MRSQRIDILAKGHGAHGCGAGVVQVPDRLIHHPAGHVDDVTYRRGVRGQRFEQQNLFLRVARPEMARSDQVLREQRLVSLRRVLNLKPIKEY